MVPLRGHSHNDFGPLLFPSNILSWATVSHPSVFTYCITSNLLRYSNLKLTWWCQWCCCVKKVSVGSLNFYPLASNALGSIVHPCLNLVLISLLGKWEPFKVSKIDSQCLHWLRRVTDTAEFQLSSVNDSAESWHLVIYYVQNLIFTDSAVSRTPLRFDLAVTMTPLSFHTAVLLTPLSDDSAAPLAIWNSIILTSSPRFSQIQWARKVYAAVAENYANSKYYISGERRVRKALFLVFDTAWAGVSRNKISALKNV